jgi:hypothetical protein
MSSKHGGTNATKDVIYIDVDDEITGIIDKVHTSDKKIIALVLPKRAAVLQSIVNMKLLKRAAADAKKNLVLITSESGLMPLAGTVGIHVAKSLNSKPEVPDAPAHARGKSELAAEAEEGADEVALDGEKSVGELSGDSPIDVDDEEEAIELDDEDDSEAGADAGKPDSKAKKFKKQFKIPDFNRFRVMLALAGVGVLLLAMVGYAAIAVWPSAKITIKTDSTAFSSNLILNLKLAPETQFDAATGVLPASIQEVKKTLTQEVPATGQQNKGEQATGVVTMTARKCGGNPFVVPSQVPSGIGITVNSLTFITQESTTFVGTGSSGGCFDYTATASTDITAQSPGEKYNVSSATFTVTGRTDVAASGSTSGGTDNIVKVVSQADVDVAKQKIAELDNQAVQQELKAALIGRDLFAVDATFTSTTPETTLSVPVNEPADTLTVTQAITYSMYGVNQEDLQKVVDKDSEGKIDVTKQSIFDYGLDKASFSIQGISPEGATVSMQTTAVAGAELEPEAIKQQVAGKKAGDAREIISAYPGVTDVEVEYSPFWVSSIPKKTSKITIAIEEPQAASSEDAESP